MDPFGLLMAISNDLSQWFIAAGIWVIALVYIYRRNDVPRGRRR